MKVKDLFPVLKEGDIILCICKEGQEEFVDQIVYGNETREIFKEYDVIEMYPYSKGHELHIEIQEPKETVVTDKGIQFNMLVNKIENMTLEELTQMLKDNGIDFIERNDLGE